MGGQLKKPAGIKFRIFATAVVVLFAVGTWRGWSLTGGGRKGMKIPKNVRQSPGGYRSYAYWRGGK